MKNNITIIDYGLGNLASIKNMIKKAGGYSEITDDVNKIEQAEKIILPGVGSFDKGIQNLKEKNLVDILFKKAFTDKIPFMGICLGMQLLTKSSEEGSEAGLGWVDAQTLKFQPTDKTIKVPHMGWTDINVLKSHPVLENLPDEPRFYFVHSYYVNCLNEENKLVSANYAQTFDAGIIRDNIFGFQFHPEKSHKYGLQLMKNLIFSL